MEVRHRSREDPHQHRCENRIAATEAECLGVSQQILDVREGELFVAKERRAHSGALNEQPFDERAEDRDGRRLRFFADVRFDALDASRG